MLLSALSTSVVPPVVLVTTAALVAAGSAVVVHPAAAAPSTAAAAAETVRERPDRVSAALTARVQGSRVEILSERTESSSTYANPDGSSTVEQSTGPIRFQDGTGAWRDVDTSLEQAVDGSVRARSHPGGLRLAGPGGASGQVRDLASVSGRGGDVVLRWRGRLPSPVVVGSKATYRGALPGMDLVVEATRTGFEQFLTLRERPASAAAVAVTLPLALRGLSARRVPGRGVELVDGSGRLTGALAEPVMWDAQVDRASGLPRRRAAVPMTVAGSGSSVELTLAPAADFLLDPATVYPVTIDPSYTDQLFPSFDTWVETGYGDQSGSTELRLGTHDDGTNVSRSFLNLTMTPWAGKQIISADLALWEYHSWSCTPTAWQVWRTGSASTATTWTSQPTWFANRGSSTETKGYSASCADGWVQADITSLIQEWADQAAGAVAIGIRAANESDPYGWKRFHSGNNATNPPRINVTYNSYPTVGVRSTVPATTCVTGASRPWVSTSTPTLRAAVSDPDGGTVYADLEVAPTGGAPIWSAMPAASGGVAGAAVAAGELAEGGAYSWRVRAYDGSLYTPAWSPWCEFAVDTTVPAAPAVASTTYPAGSWNTTGGAGSFTLSSSDTGSGVDSWRYWLNADTPTVVSAGASTSVSITPPNGWNTLHVQALDMAGNASAETIYTFGAVAGVTSPTAGQRTQRFVTLDAIGPPAATGVRFQYQLPGTSTWTDIPTGHVTVAGAPVGSWPVPTTAGPTAARAPANLAWDVRATMSIVDGPVTVRAVLTAGASSWTTDAVTTTLDQKAFGESYATVKVGPGVVSLLTGNFSVTVPDVSIEAWGSDLTVSRAFNSLSPGGTGVLGAGWQSTLAVQDVDAAWVTLKDTGSGVLLTDVTGAVTVFARSGSSYVAQGTAAAAGLILTKSSTPDEFTLADVRGATSVFGFASGPATATLTNPRLYRVVRLTEPGDNQVTSYSYNADGTPAQVLAPKPTAMTVCDSTTWSAGCRALQPSYSAGKLTAVTIKTTDGAGEAVKTAAAACYSYDTAGRLWKVWDPRINGTTCATPILPTTYTYDTAGRLATVTPSGLAPWVLGYDAQGRLSTVSRTHDAANGGGTETTTIRYDVSIATTATTDESHPDLSPARTAAWAQTAIPVTATAVFEAGDSVSTTDLRDAQVHALDVNGREVNTADFSGTGQAGWKVRTEEYDGYGNRIRILTAANRDLALSGDPTSLGLPAGTAPAAVARAVDTRSAYSADGTDLLDTYGPLHAIAIDGAWVYAREHTRITYGSLAVPGADPTVDGPLHQEVQRTVGASQSADPTPTGEVDVRTSRTSYGLPGDSTGWTLRAPMRATTVVAGGQDIVRETVYDPGTGLVVQSRMPSAAGSATAVGTTKTTYYTSGVRNDANCVNSAWVNLACRVEPASQPTSSGLPELPVKHLSYDWLGRPTTLTETVVDAGGVTRTRTATTEYENAGWSNRRARTLVTGDVGTPVPAIVTTYHPTTGLAATVGTAASPAPGPGLAGTMTLGYDDFGQSRSFTDADGATTAFVYDSAGRLESVTSTSAGGTVLGTTGYGYDAGTERRGLATSISDSAFSGTVTGHYDADGELAGQTFPNGMTQALSRDPAGRPVRVVYAKAGVEWLNDSRSENIHGQARWHSGAAGWQGYGYDPAGRLVSVWDQRIGAPCVQRGYQYDVDSNRTLSQAWPPGATGACPPPTAPTTVTHSYDGADRLLPQGADAGTGYDAFGRVTTLPQVAAGGTAVTTGYYVNDMVASQAQGAQTRAWTLDPSARLREASGSATTTQVLHYSDPSSDSPAWVDESKGAATLSATRYVGGLDERLAAVVSVIGTSATTRWQLVDLAGHVATSAADDPAATTPDGTTLDADEFGDVSSPAARYGWLGGLQRSSDALGGLVLMGVRLYSPALGRFLQVDPVPGGSCSAYDYACGDPVNNQDVSGCVPCYIPFWAYPGYTTGVYYARYGAWRYTYWYTKSYSWWWDALSDFTLLSIVSWQYQNRYRFVTGYRCRVLGYYGWFRYWVRVQYVSVYQSQYRDRITYRVKFTGVRFTETSIWRYYYSAVYVHWSYTTHT
jgi:RHS repeat-associated protein